MQAINLLGKRFGVDFSMDPPLSGAPVTMGTDGYHFNSEREKSRIELPGTASCI